MRSPEVNPPPQPSIDLSQYEPSDIITRDVCVIGGGAAGTYAAIRLRQLNKSVVLVERQSRLGGQTTTYTDPVTGKSIDYGVTYFQNLPLVRNFFDHFGIPPSSFPTPAEAAHAKEKYIAQLDRYPYLKVGFDLPNPVPEDLLLPFGDFLRKYGMDAAIAELGASINPLGDWPSMPTLYVFKYLNSDVMEGGRSGFVRPVDHNNSAPYVAAQRELGDDDDLLLDSSVRRTHRDHPDGWTYIEIQNISPLSRPRLIRAKKVIVAAPPKPDNLNGIDLTEAERTLFSHFSNTYFYTALVRITGLPDDICYLNRGAEDPFWRPHLPAMLLLRPNEVSDLRTVHYASPHPLSEEQIRRGIVQDIHRVRGLAQIDGEVSEPEFVAVGNHSPYQLTVSADVIADGFYERLNALQGRKSTFYTGAAFESHNSPQIWQFTEDLLLQRVLPSLEE
ncbi:NAD(P)-binding protein [Aspergillus tanneri]|uniref:Amine oxidase domain-containing protein n=1 Tax=Aspergillus tanneri TaxID=1220188 RepID=A0A5M9MPI6_9EURO|nr:uncharacterized protein ATNIH1004_004703 [Aspergillus tanneri]KAA8648818.1 hypothetical protein ATNIH1004_004703 [Aspergillus tanneri]